MRTYSGVLNIVTGTFFTIIISFLRFFIIKIFILKQGNEINGLYQLFAQIMAYLNLAEGGVGTALNFSLYKPLQEKNYEKINNILLTAKKIYFYIGVLILILGVIISPFIKNFLKKNTLDERTVIVLFILYVLKTVFDYWTNITRFLLQADQKEYIINMVSFVLKIIDIFLEYYLLILNFSLTYILIKNIIILILTNIFLTYKSKKKYNWLNLRGKKDYSFLKNTKYTFFYSICGAIVYNTDYILLGRYRTLEEITFYSNYMFVFSFLIGIFVKGITSLSAGLGNVYAENELVKLKNVYRELFAITFFVTSITSIGIYYTLEDFISLWLGKNYILDKYISYCFLIIYIHTMTRQPAGILCNSVGLFKDSKNIVILEMLTNIVISLLLVKKYGIFGVLVGTIVAHGISNFWMYPKLCFNKIFNESVFNYFLEYVKYILISVFIFIIVNIISKLINFQSKTFLELFLKVIILGTILLFIHILIYYFIEPFKKLLLRLKILCIKRG